MSLPLLHVFEGPTFDITHLLLHHSKYLGPKNYLTEYLTLTLRHIELLTESVHTKVDQTIGPNPYYIYP